MYVDMKTSVTTVYNGQSQMQSIMLNKSLRMIKIKLIELLEPLFPYNVVKISLKLQNFVI